MGTRRAKKGRKTRSGRAGRKPVSVHRVNERTYMADSQSWPGAQYELKLTDSGWTCGCPYYQNRRSRCKHMRAVEADAGRAVREVARLAPVADFCPACGSDSIVKHGIRHNRHHDVQRCSCRTCGRRFSANLGFTGMRASPETITSAVQLHFTGLSLRDIREFLLQIRGEEFSHVAVGGWISKYVTLMESLLAAIRPGVGDRWHADEVWLRIRGDMKYLFALMDGRTRYILAQEVADSKHRHNARSLLRNAKEAAGKKPKEFVTDGLDAYHLAYHKEFWTNRVPRTEHIQDIHVQHKLKNNNIQERLNGEFRDLEKVTRGLKKEDSATIRGFRLHHNCVKPHMGLDGDTPADRAGIIIEGPNKWLTLIQNAALRMAEEGSESHDSANA